MKIKTILFIITISFLLYSATAYCNDNSTIKWIKPNPYVNIGHVSTSTVTTDNRYLVTGNETLLTCWDLLNVKLAFQLKGHTKDIRRLFISADNKYALSGDEAGVLKIWDIINGKEIKTINAHDNPILIINLSNDNRYIMTESYGGSIKLWDFQTGKELHQFKGQRQTISTLSQDGKRVIGQDENGNIIVWNSLSGDIIKKIKIPNEKYRITLFSSDGHYAIIEREDSSFYPELWDIDLGKKIRTFNFKEYDENNISFMMLWGTFSADNKKILSILINGRRYVLWDIAMDQPILVFSNSLVDGVISTAFSKDSEYIVSGCGDKTARLWDTTTGKELLRLISFEDGEWLIITPEGYYNASKKADEYMIVTYSDFAKCSLNNYRETFFRPDLVKDALTDKALNGCKKISDVPIPKKCRIGN